MTKKRLVALAFTTALCGSFAVGCSDDSTPADAARDSAPGDSATTDSATADSASPGDTGTTDSASPRDTGAADTGGPDCSVIGCAPATSCGETCDAVCGCCGCSATEGTCGSDSDGASFATNCPTGCYERTSCGDSDCSVVGGVAVCGTCGSIELIYEGLTTGDATLCTIDADCHVLSGQCSVGLGGCYHAVNTDTTRDQLAALGAMYTAASCTSAVCDCTAPPSSVRCDAGSCLAM
ncbi:MAG: hypothetical protein JRH11_17810 [Deltaproteobacteria bacterium]|nr:hypothetical protein [Deltaproteobacteria bacterium]